MTNQIYCEKEGCHSGIKFNDDDYYECEQEETMQVVKCPKCETPHGITWSTSVDFIGHIADEEDLKEFDVEDSIS